MKIILVFEKIYAALAAVVILMAVNPAHATLYSEVADAGITAETAEYIPWKTTIIYGVLHNDDGADVYGFEWGGGYFEANTEGSDFDTMLSLFDYSGSLIAFNDDFGPFSQISWELDAGSYFLGVTFYDNNYQGDMMYYVGAGIEASYQIHKNISSPLPVGLADMADPVNIPEPASLALFGIGLTAIVLNRRREGYLMKSQASGLQSSCRVTCEV